MAEWFQMRVYKWAESVSVANHVKARQCTELAEILLIYLLHIFCILHVRRPIKLLFYV